MIGYKAFDKNLSCRGFQFEVGKTYKKDTPVEELKCCTDKVFHFCRDIFDIEKESCYKLKTARICEVIAGDYVKEGFKYGTNCITILRELTDDDKKDIVSENIGMRNTGSQNKGDWNSGNNNDGSCNTGNWNTGNWNTGDDNKGNFNTGGGNTGSSNTGCHNTGDHNTGNSNFGDYNTKNNNTGDFNTGDYNSGSENSGFQNYGHSNTGNYNVGVLNTGNNNCGDYNTGNYNRGDKNSGSWNSGNYNRGFFNTMDAPLRFFNKETSVPFDKITFPLFLFNIRVTQWVSKYQATELELEQYKEEIEARGGFLKKYTYKEAFRKAWDATTNFDRMKLLDLPNWDNEIFKEISGIDAEAEIAKEDAE